MVCEVGNVAVAIGELLGKKKFADYEAAASAKTIASRTSSTVNSTFFTLTRDNE